MNGVHQFKVGDFECAILSDGIARNLSLQPTGLFPDAPQAELAQALRRHGRDERTSTPYTVNCLYIRTDNQHVLVDTGFGILVDPDMGKLVANLQKVGVQPDLIDVVIITHLHFDHIGGLMHQDGSPVFPNARLITPQAEWDNGMAETTQQMVDERGPHLSGFAQRLLSTLRNTSEIVAMDAELLPGIQLVEATGHTPGHVAVEVTSKGDRLLNIVDSVIDVIHIEYPEWGTTHSMNPEKTLETRRRLFQQAVNDKALVTVCHFDFPALGYIDEGDDTWIWRPLHST